MFTSAKSTKAYLQTEVRSEPDGDWLARRAACRLLSVSAPTLRDWRLHVIPWLPGERLRHKPLSDANGSGRYYCRGQLEKIINARAAAIADPSKWVLVEEGARRFGWCDRRKNSKRPGRTIWRWLREGCADIGGAVPIHELRRVLIVDSRGREQSAEKMHVFVPDLERIKAVQAMKIARLCEELKDRTPMTEAVKRLRVDRQWLRRRFTHCPERGEPLDAVRREVRRANDYRTRRIFDYFILTAHLDELERARRSNADIYTDQDGRRWYSRSAALAEAGREFPHLSARVLQEYAGAECPQLDYQVLHTIERPRPAGKGGRHRRIHYFLEEDLIRFKPADATKRRPAPPQAPQPQETPTPAATPRVSRPARVPREQATKTERQKPEREKHERWRTWHEVEGLSYEQIVRRHQRETGENVTRGAVVMAIRRQQQRC